MIPKQTLNIKGELLDLSTPKVMGILNVTPDSFYEGSRISSVNGVLKAAENMLQEGATILDIGGYSSRPNGKDISEAEELNRVIAPIETVSKAFPRCLISIDTFRSGVAKAAFEAGASLVNDISGGRLDPNMLSTVGKLKAPYVGMHMRGTPQTMQSLTQYDDLKYDVAEYFAQLSSDCIENGINDLIIDPGFGFSKTLEQNFDLLKQLDYFNHLEYPILVGISRKSMIYKTLNIDPSEALNGTTGLNAIALIKGASILRVHDVKEAVELTELIGHLK